MFKTSPFLYYNPVITFCTCGNVANKFLQFLIDLKKKKSNIGFQKACINELVGIQTVHPQCKQNLKIRKHLWTLFDTLYPHIMYRVRNFNLGQSQE